MAEEQIKNQGLVAVNLSGKITKPISLLIEKVSAGLGRAYAPLDMAIMAHAKAYSDKMAAQTAVEIQDIQIRATNRWIAEEVRNQANIESVVEQAIPQLDSEADPKNIDEDWMASFLDKVKLVSDKDAQALWASVLAGEANSPGKFSKRTMNVLATLEKVEAEAFQLLCNFCIFDQAKNPHPFIGDHSHGIYRDKNLDFSIISHLESIGLVMFSELSGYIHKANDVEVCFTYNNTKIVIRFQSNVPGNIPLGMVIFTDVGRRIFELCHPVPIAGFSEYLVSYWNKSRHLIVHPEVTTEPPTYCQRGSS